MKLRPLTTMTGFPSQPTDTAGRASVELASCVRSTSAAKSAAEVKSARAEGAEAENG